MRITSVFLAVLAFLAGIPCQAGVWDADFAHQPLKHRPRLEVRYTDGTRTAFEILAEDYELVGELRKPHRLVHAKSGEEWLSLAVVGEDGVEYSTHNAEVKSRINLYRRGPYFCEVRWLDVQVADEAGKLAPLKGDLALYCYPDKLLASITWHGTEDFAAKAVEVRGLVRASFEPEPFAAGAKQMFATPLFGETEPLSNHAFLNHEAVAPMAYDAVRGCYTIGSLSEGGFQGHFYNHPNRYETASFTVMNDERPRTVYICHENTGGDKGSVEGGVLLDEEGHPLPITVQISKNFAGEKEEKFYNPPDTPFSETYFPLFLEPGESCKLTSLHLYQNWGNHMVKQFSSLGAWMDYFHSSTGVTETTCYVPFKFAGLPGVDIADFRAMSQYAFWPTQPQHDNVAGHSFLWFNDGDDWQYMAYRGTTYRSTGPNWMDIGFEYLSTDGAIHAMVDSFELPQVDELRQFVHVRYDVRKRVSIPNARENFRLLTAASWVQHLRYTHFAASGMEDRPLSFEKDHFGVCGHPLPAENSFLAVYGDAKGGNAFIVRNWKARVKGKDVGPAASVLCEESGDTRLLLVADADALDLSKGDFFEFDAVIMPFGSAVSADAARREAVVYGAKAPRITEVATGKKCSDFPAVVRAKRGEAEFTIQGGRDVAPIIVTHLKDYRCPRIERKTEKGWRPLNHARLGLRSDGEGPAPPSQVAVRDGVQLFVDGKDGFGAVFLVHSDDAPQTLRVTSGPAGKTPERIRVAAFRPPADAPESAQLQHAAQIRAPWMEAPIFLRFPETLNTDTLDYIDHRRADMPPRVEPAPLASVWNESEGGSIWFSWGFDNQAVGGRLSPDVDCVDLEFWIENRRDKAVNMRLQFCPALGGTMFEDHELERTWGLVNGEWKRLCDTDRGTGNPASCHYRVAGGPSFTTAEPWGVSKDTLDVGAVAVTSVDGKYLFAIAWPGCERVGTNADIPCVHADLPPLPAPPGKRLHLRGKVYLMEGTLDDFAARLRREVEPMRRDSR